MHDKGIRIPAKTGQDNSHFHQRSRMRLSFSNWLPLLALLALTGGCGPADDGLGAATPAQPKVSSWAEPEGEPASVEKVAALDPQRWESGRAALNRGYTTRVVWFRIELSLPPNRSDGGWVLEFGDPLLNFIDLHLPGQQSAATHSGWQLIRMGAKLPFASRPLPSRNFAVPLDWAPGSGGVLYARVQSGTSVHLPTRLLSHEELIADDLRALVLNVLYIGVMTGLLLYNLLLMFRVRELLSLYYAGWLFMFGLFVLVMDGMSF